MKNAIIYRLPEGWPPDIEYLGNIMLPRRFVGCSGWRAASSGWVAPAKHSPGLAHMVGRHILITLQTETKILPASVVKRRVDEKVADVERSECRRVGRQERWEIADTVRLDLIPKAFSRLDRVTAYIDTKAHRLVIDTASKARADELVCKIIETSEINVRRFETADRPEIAMQRWLSVDVPDEITIDDECDLVGHSEGRPTVKYQRHALDGEDILRHLSLGKVPTRMAITCKGRASFVLTDDICIKRFSLVNAPDAPIDGQTDEERFDADAALYASEIACVIDWIESALGGPLERE